MHCLPLNAKELFTMEYINIDETKEPMEMVWKQKKDSKKERKKGKEPSIFRIL